MNIKELQAALRHFAAERDWHPFHSPKNLTTALVVEAAELAEIFQWLTEEDSRKAHEIPELKARVDEEAADVFLYLLQVADLSKVDLMQVASEKMARNAIKYPPKRRIEIATAAVPRPAETHVLLDYENVQPSGDDLRAMVPGVSDVWVFHSPQQKQVDARFTSFGKRVVLVPIKKPGKNALDFHLSYDMGYITSRNPDARFVVVANDKGYDPMLDHARELGFAVERRTFGREPSHVRATNAVSDVSQPAIPAQTIAVKAAAPAKAPSKTAASSKPAATKKPGPKKAPPQAPRKTAPSKSAAANPASKAAQPSAAVKRLVTSTPSQAKIAASLKKMGNKRPAKMAALRRTVQMLLGPSSSVDALSASINNLIVQGSISMGQDGVLTYKL